MRQLAIHSGHVRCVAYSPDGKLLATASNDYSVRLIDTASGKRVARWADLGAVMQAVAFSPDGRQVAFGGQMRYRDGRVWLHLATTEEESQRAGQALDLPIPPTASGVALTGLACLPEGTFLLGVTGDRILRHRLGFLHVWKMPGFELLHNFPVSHGVQHLAVRRDGKQLALGTGFGWMYVSTEDWQFSPLQSQGRAAMAVAFSPDGRLLAVASGWNIILQETGDRRIVRTMKGQGHGAKVTSLAFTPDGQRLLSGSWDRTARLWSPHTGQQIASYDWQRGKVQYVAVAPDGMTAAAACDKGVVIWDLDE